jgi:hypothetical protein
MSDTNVKTVPSINPKASLRVFQSALAAACDDAGIALEDWQTQHVRVLRAELGKVNWQDGKAGALTIGKNCTSARTSQAKGVTLDGKAAHGSIRFQREADMATAYVNEFTGANVGLTEGSSKYITDLAERVAELNANKKAEDKVAA